MLYGMYSRYILMYNRGEIQCILHIAKQIHLKTVYHLVRNISRVHLVAFRTLSITSRELFFMSCQRVKVLKVLVRMKSLFVQLLTLLGVPPLVA